jgi:hypothetical protein
MILVSLPISFPSSPPGGPNATRSTDSDLGGPAERASLCSLDFSVERNASALSSRGRRAGRFAATMPIAGSACAQVMIGSRRRR